MKIAVVKQQGNYAADAMVAGWLLNLDWTCVLQRCQPGPLQACLVVRNCSGTLHYLENERNLSAMNSTAGQEVHVPWSESRILCDYYDGASQCSQEYPWTGISRAAQPGMLSYDSSCLQIQLAIA